MQAGGGEAVLVVPLAGEQATDGERLVAQTVAVLQQQETLGIQGGDRDLLLPREAMAGWQRDQEGVAGEWHDVGGAAVAGQCEQQHIQAVGGEAGDEVGGRVLA